MTYKSYTSFTYESNNAGPADNSYNWDGHIYKSFSFSNSRFYLSDDITDYLSEYGTDVNTGDSLYHIPDSVNNGIGYFYWNSNKDVICRIWSSFGTISGSTITGWVFHYKVPTSVSSSTGVRYSRYPIYLSDYSIDSNGFKYKNVTGSYQDDEGIWNTIDIYKDYGNEMYLTCEEI